MNTGTSLVTLDNINPKQALNMHLEVKERGPGELAKFIQYETAHTPGQYYYRMRKLGVMPFKSRGSNKNVIEFKSRRTEVVVPEDRIERLEKEVQQLKQLLSSVSLSPSQRALTLLSGHSDQLNYKSKKFLASIISRDTASLSAKQEAWMSNLERQYLG